MQLHIDARVFVIITIIFLNGEAFGQNRPESFTFNFTRVQESVNALDTLSGIAFFFYGKLYLHVRHPINQIFFVDGNKIKIYYPENKTGYRIMSGTPFDLPIVNSLLASLEDDYGLAQIGFEIRSTSVLGDTLVTNWEHSTGSDAGTFDVFYRNDIIVKARFNAPSVSLETVLKNHKTYNGYVIPTTIKTRHSAIRDSVTETLYVDGLFINPYIPESILNFEFPDEAVIEERRL